MKFDPKAIEAAVDEIHRNKCDGHDYSSEEAAEATIKAYCNAAGVVCVPLEPTLAMFEAVIDWTPRFEAEATWRAMVRASQEGE